MRLPAPLGGAFATQAFALDPLANALGVTATNGARAQIGAR